MVAKKLSPNVKPISIRALAGRTVETFALKSLIRGTGAQLTRKGRSANWLLFADEEQMRHIVEGIAKSSQPSWQWLGQLIATKHQQYAHQQLRDLVARDPSMTVNKLVALTDCTLAEARRVLDEQLEL